VAYANDTLIDEAERWLERKSGIQWFDQDWRFWDELQDEAALDGLGWQRTVVQSGQRYRVSLRVIARDRQRRS